VLVARRFVVVGRVQRVGFRYFLAEAAAIEGLGGWVRNRPDGCVEVLVEGEAESVQRFEWKVRSGPPGARVSSVEVAECAPSGRLGEFRVDSTV
jgi:acylphosphatase